MKDIVLLALDNGVASTVVGPLEVFAYAGGIWNYLTGVPIELEFRVRVATLDGRPAHSRTGMPIHADCDLAAVDHADVILVTSCAEDVDRAIETSGPAVRWLRRHHARGATLGSICSGLAVLAMTGLLDGKRATTHWGLIDVFRRRFPAIRLEPDQLVVDEGRVLTAGGGYAGNDLALHLVERFCGKPVAKQCADALLLETGRHLQSKFAAVMHHRLHADDQVQRIQEWLERYYMTTINLDTLASEHGMSPRNFIRRFKQASGETPLNYLHKLRVEAAKRLLEKSDLRMDAVADQVGYRTEAHFRLLFKRHTQLTPAAYRTRHGTSAAVRTHTPPRSIGASV